MGAHYEQPHRIGRTGPRLVLALVLLTDVLFSPGTAPAGGAAPAAAAEKPRVRTGRKACPLPPAPALPPAGGKYLDPTFGTQILRVTDEADGDSQNAYSYYPAFNRDSTMFFIHCKAGPRLYHFDPNAFRIVGKEPLFAARPPHKHAPRWEDCIWSGADPNALFCHGHLRLWRYDVRARKYHLVRDFSGELAPGHLHQMSKSLDDNVFGFSRQDPKWKLVGCLVWRRDSDSIALRHDTTDLDEIQVDKTGRWCVVKTAKQGRGSLLADDEAWATVSFYVANKLPGSGAFRNEIVQVKTDGSQQVRRLAHHRSVYRGYWDSPRACISRDGRFITYTSNFEGRGRGVFILRVPSGKGGGRDPR